MSHPFAHLSDDDLRERKDEVMRGLLNHLVRVGVEPDYPQALLTALRRISPTEAEHIAVLEALVEIESIKYTLCARRLRQIDIEEQS
jgi:hypothetical protein